jgi:hypothetical protein
MKETGGRTHRRRHPTGAVATARLARQPRTAFDVYRFIDRTMHKATPEEFADESAVDEESSSLPRSNRTSTAKP